MSRIVLALAVAVAIGGCMPRARGPRGPVVSPTGIVYAPGIPPGDTRFSQTATLYLSQGRLDRALQQALEGVESDAGNPIHYFVAGTAHARLGHYEDAHRMFIEAQRLYPAYELDIEPERESAWAEAFNEGLEAFGEGDIERTIAAWQEAALIYDRRPEAHRNLGILLAQEARYEEAIVAYRRGIAGLDRRPATRVLPPAEIQARTETMLSMEANLAQLLLFTSQFAEAEPLLRRQLERDSSNAQLRNNLAATLSGQGRDAEATEIYTALLSAESLEGAELFRIGVALFRSAAYDDAAEAFRRLTELQPHSRDAWFNYANCLFAAEAWESLAPVGDRLLELDPLSENAALIAARADLELGDEQAAVRGLERIEAAPVLVAELQMRPAVTETSVQGRIIGKAAEPGTPVRLRFVFYDDVGVVGTQTITVSAPPSGQSARFEATFRASAAAYSYEVVR